MRNTAHRPDIVWLTPRAGREPIAEHSSGRGLQLSRAQKWDLLRICLAAMASAAFFSAPFLLSGPPPTPPAPMAGAPSLPVEQAAGVQDAPDRISIVTTDISVPLTRGLVRPVALRSPRPAAHPSSSDASRERRRASAEDAPGVAQRIGRAIAGDGRYAVRPFPTLDANRY